MWRQLVAELYADHAFAAGASEDQLSAAESEMGAALPFALRELLGESNGVWTEYQLSLVWPLERIVEDNLRFRSNQGFRSLYMPFDPLLFFGEAGNGDQFAFVVLDGVVRSPDIFVWDHENDSRSWVAPDLQRYLEWWADGHISL